MGTGGRGYGCIIFGKWGAIATEGRGDRSEKVRGWGSMDANRCGDGGIVVAWRRAVGTLPLSIINDRSNQVPST